MNLNMNQILNNITGSEIIKISQKIKASEHHVFNLSIGDFDSEINSIPTKLRDGIIEEYMNNSTDYPMSQGELTLRQAVSKFSYYAPEEILIGAGARPLIYTLFKGIVEVGDYVLYSVPSWNNNHYCFLHGTGKIEIECTPENNFFPTVEDIKSNLYRTRLVCLCSPQNPTGKAIDPDVLKGICDAIVLENKTKERKTYLFFDQIYSELAPMGFVHPLEVCPDIKDYLICIDGVSKSLCATGIRVGWMTGPVDLITKMTSVFSHIGAWAPKPEQLAVASYLNSDEMFSFINDKIMQYGEISESICYFLLKMKNLHYKVDYKTPDGGIYISLYLGYNDKFESLEAFIDFLIENGIGIVPFEYFGSKSNKGWFRISIGTIGQHQLESLFLKLEETIKKLHDK